MNEVAEYEKWVKWVKDNKGKYMSQSSMAKDLGVSQATLSRILSGKRTGKRTFQKTKNGE
jgi:predicted transcriptional regulator